MSDLRELQQDFAKFWQSNGADPAFAARASGNTQVYLDSIIGGISQNLSSIYPVCERLVAAEFFVAMAEVFIKQTPFHDPDLSQYGGEFADFIAQFPPVAQLVYLADVARLEWAWHQALIGPDSKILNNSALSAISVDKQADISFCLPENSTLLDSIYPISQIWQVNQLGYDGEQEIALHQGGNKLIIWRQDLEVLIEELSVVQWQFLQCTANKLNLGTICQQHIADISEVLPQCVQRGWLRHFYIG